RRVDSLLRDDLSRASDGMTMLYLRQIQLASALVLLAASTAFAHGDVDEHARLSDLPWSSEWWIWIPLVLSLVLYVVGFRHVWASASAARRPVHRNEAIAYVLGWLALAV